MGTRGSTGNELANEHEHDQDQEDDAEHEEVDDDAEEHIQHNKLVAKVVEEAQVKLEV